VFAKKIEVKLDGVIAFDFDNGKFIPKEIYGYEFNNRFNEYLKGVIIEDAEIRKIFITNDEESSTYAKAESELLDLIFSKDVERAKDANKRYDDLTKLYYAHYPDVNWLNIINSVLEFTILEEIGLNQNRYYNNNEVNKEWYRTYTRDDLDDSVFQNKIIDIITKDPHERGMYYDRYGTGIVFDSRVDFKYFPISLNLPLKSKIFRNKHNILTIDTKYYAIQILPCFHGMGKLVNPILMEENGWHNPYEANIKLNITKKGRIINDKKAKYALKCLDELLQGIYQHASFGAFEQEINLKGLIVLKKILNDILAESRPVKKLFKKAIRRKRS
jgi:hypothetical protein